MDIKRAEERKHKWGDKPCDHPKIDKERVKGIETGDFRCTQCGKLFDSREEWENSRAKRDKSN